MKKYIAVLIILFSSELYAQQSPENIIRNFYEILNKGDSTNLRSFFHKDAVVEHLDLDTTISFKLDEFMGVCPKFKSGTFQEEVLNVEFMLGMNGYVELVKVQYKFFVNGKYDHCGEDSFIFSIAADKKTYIDKIYSVPGQCWEESEDEKVDTASVFNKLEYLMNTWHVDAAETNFESYFGLMSDDFYFLGTDPKERWSKEEFSSFCKPYFDKGEAWEFDTNWRNWYISEDGNTAWFDESLDTWMNECRGSGVFQKVYGEWKLFHYNLTVLIENEKMDKFIKLRKK